MNTVNLEISECICFTLFSCMKFYVGLWNTELQSHFYFALFLQNFEHQQLALWLPAEMAAAVARWQTATAGCKRELCSSRMVSRAKPSQRGPWGLCLWFVFSMTFALPCVSMKCVQVPFWNLAVALLEGTWSWHRWACASLGLLWSLGFNSVSLHSVLLCLSTEANPRE